MRSQTSCSKISGQSDLAFLKLPSLARLSQHFTLERHRNFHCFLWLQSDDTIKTLTQANVKQEQSKIKRFGTPRRITSISVKRSQERLKTAKKCHVVD